MRNLEICTLGLIIEMHTEPEGHKQYGLFSRWAPGLNLTKWCTMWQWDSEGCFPLETLKRLNYCDTVSAHTQRRLYLVCVFGAAVIRWLLRRRQGIRLRPSMYKRETLNNSDKSLSQRERERETIQTLDTNLDLLQCVIPPPMWKRANIRWKWSEGYNPYGHTQITEEGGRKKWERSIFEYSSLPLDELV